MTLKDFGMTQNAFSFPKYLQRSSTSLVAKQAMERTPVSSSIIRSVGYDHASFILEIQFRSGKVYQYRGIPHGIYVELMSAGSKGSYFDAHIRNAGYDYQRLP
jgi:hypothetical protein